MSIRARLLLLVLFATSIPALLAGAFFHASREDQITEASRSLVAFARYAGNDLEDTATCLRSVEDCVETGMAMHRNPGAPSETHQPNGRWGRDRRTTLSRRCVKRPWPAGWTPTLAKPVTFERLRAALSRWLPLEQAAASAIPPPARVALEHLRENCVARLKAWQLATAIQRVKSIPRPLRTLRMDGVLLAYFSVWP